MTTKLLQVKRLFFVSIILTSLIAISSCDYDDSNDIDIITPNDSTDTHMVVRPEYR